MTPSKKVAGYFMCKKTVRCLLELRFIIGELLSVQDSWATHAIVKNIIGWISNT